MKLRQHRGGFEESMQTTIEIEPTKAALLQAIQESPLAGLPLEMTENQIHVESVRIDPRNGWNTHLVTIQGWGVYGYTDGPLNSIDVGSPNTIDGAVTSYYGVSTVNVLTPEEAQAKRPGYQMPKNPEEIPFATSPFMEEPRPPEMARDQTVLHQTVGGKGAVGRIK